MTYLKIVKENIARFENFSIEQIPRDQNVQADALANLGSAFNEPTMENIPIIHLMTPTIEMKETVQMNEEVYNWSLDIWNYLKYDQLPENKMEARKIRFQASRYTIFKDQLYKRSITELILRCITSKGQMNNLCYRVDMGFWHIVSHFFGDYFWCIGLRRFSRLFLWLRALISRDYLNRPTFNVQDWTTCQDPKGLVRVPGTTTTTEEPEHYQPKVQTEWDDQDKELVSRTPKCKRMLIIALPNDIFMSLHHCISSQDLWSKLLRQLERGVTTLKNNRTMCINEYHEFKAKEGESLKDTYSRFNILISKCRRTCVIRTNEDNNTLVLNSLGT
ncbi:hypothetical protein OSB04_006691 [Centaurea solstitialis]|uniref:RNase H type-1 domain-containing protein n=1 Tax=Centaurea solstitialis TaxID=347529 RepID=A0AA38WSU5_9ASTR|nr:hypothetical protein OSB04_006691 [Centaurea solstitialis]